MLDFDQILLELGFGKYQILCLVGSFFFALSGQIQFIFVPFLQNSVANEFKINNYELLYLSSSEYFGFFLGSIASGYFGDYFGRKKTILINTFFLTLFLIILANVGSYQIFVIIRFFCAICHVISYLNSYILFFEIIDANNRGKISNFLDLFFSLGAILLVVYMWLFLNDINSGNWRLVIYFTAIHSLIYFITTFLILDESVRFNLIKNNYEKAFTIINKIAKYNKNIENYMDEEKKIKLIEWTDNFLIGWNMKNSKRNCCEWLFFNELKKITPILWLIFFTVTFASFQIYYTVPFTLIQLHAKTSSSKNAIQLIYMFLAEFPSPFLAMLLIDKKLFGRVNSLSFFLFLLFLLFFFFFFLFMTMKSFN